MYDPCVSELTQSLLSFLLTIPLPSSYRSILQEQLLHSSISVEQYHDCFKMLFESNGNTKMFPLELPSLLQGGQVLKDSGPISFQLFVEKGYIVQFEVVDMGLNAIDWNYFWSHAPIYDIEYD